MDSQKICDAGRKKGNEIRTNCHSYSIITIVMAMIEAYNNQLDERISKLEKLASASRDVSRKEYEISVEERKEFLALKDTIKEMENQISNLLLRETYRHTSYGPASIDSSKKDIIESIVCGENGCERRTEEVKSEPMSDKTYELLEWASKQKCLTAIDVPDNLTEYATQAEFQQAFYDYKYLQYLVERDSKGNSVHCCDWFAEGIKCGVIFNADGEFRIRMVPTDKIGFVINRCPNPSCGKNLS